MDVINTPGKKWFKACKDQSSAGCDVAGYFSVKRGGIVFHDLDGTPFAFLVSRPTESFFVTCSMTSEGLRYMFSTCSATDKKLGIDTLSYRGRRELAESISGMNLCFKATQALAKHKLSIEDFVAMANGSATDEKNRLAFFKAGLTVDAQGIETDGYLLASTLGRMMLSHHGYHQESGRWQQKSATAA